MAGLIDTQLTGTKQRDMLPAGKLSEATATSYDPQQRGVEANETVSGQLKTVLDTDSPLLQRARARAQEAANARGLVNSSIAVQSGEAAMIDAALPIASADASVYNLASRENQNAMNQSRQFGASAVNTAGAQNVSEANAIQKIKSTAEAERGLIGARVAGEQTLIQDRSVVDTALQTLKGKQSVTLANIEANYKMLMQANASAADTFNAAIQQIGTILRDPNTAPEMKESAVAGVNQLLESNLAVTGSIANLDLGGLLKFNTAVATQTAAPAIALTQPAVDLNENYGAGDY